MTTPRPVTDAELRDALRVPTVAGLPIDVLDAVHTAVVGRSQLPRRRWWPRSMIAGRHFTLILITVLAATALAAVAAGIGQSPPRDARFASGSIAFDREGTIVVANADGSDPTPVLDAPADPGLDSGTIAFAPDRRHLAVVRSGTGTARDVVIVPAGADVPLSHAVTSEPVGHELYWWGGWAPWFAWSPDGRSLMVPADGERALSVLGLDGRPRSFIALPAGFVWGSPLPGMWSPDGRWIAAFGCVDPCDIKFDTRVLLVRADGTDTHWLTSDRGGNEWGPVVAWAPDGRIALAEVADALVTMTDGSVLRRTAMRGYVSGFAWSTDGTELAVVSGDELWVIDSDGSVRDVTPAHGPIRWAPDGRSLLFTRGTSSGTGSSIWTVPARGGTPQVLVSQIDVTFDIADGGAP